MGTCHPAQLDNWQAQLAEVVEWQTRRFQKPMSLKARDGSNPSFGTDIHLPQLVLLR